MKFLLVIIFLASFRLEARAPEWFSDFIKTTPGCDRELLCVAGEGKTLADASGGARSEAAKFFQTKINSTSFLSTTTGQVGLNPVAGSFDEWTNKTVMEETSEIISGLEIKRQEELDGQYYVLMALNREISAKLLKEKMETLDLENVKLMELNSRFVYPKVLKNLALASALYERYSLLTERPLALKVKKEFVQGKINNLSPLKLGIVSKGKRLPPKLSHFLIDLLAPLKVVVIPKKSSPKYILKTEMIIENQYFKVEGFKKLNIILRLELQNAHASALGKMSAFSEQVARTDEQAIEKALPEIRESLQERLDQLTTIRMDD
ncbi:MAG: LPP20 family lipoprotein [Bacteriovorax sp.]|nr:LPP20 family lipoprotein [Bacteriovorax sp.]